MFVTRMCFFLQWKDISWWRHQMETFSALLALCAGNLPVNCEFPTQRPVTRSFDVFFNLRLVKRLSKQSWGWWFETPSRSLWRHCNMAQLMNCRQLSCYEMCRIVTCSYHKNRNESKNTFLSFKPWNRKPFESWVPNGFPAQSDTNVDNQ